MTISDAEDDLMVVLRNAGPDRYSPPSLRELAQAILAAGYTRAAPAPATRPGKLN